MSYLSILSYIVFILVTNLARVFDQSHNNQLNQTITKENFPSKLKRDEQFFINLQVVVIIVILNLHNNRRFIYLFGVLERIH